jgi:hypothetical protein
MPKAKNKKVEKILGSRTAKAAQTLPDNFPALIALSHAIFSDFINGETDVPTRKKVSQALNETIIPTLELGIRIKIASGLSLKDFLTTEASMQEATLEEKLSAHVNGALSGETKMNVPATKLLISSLQQSEQMKLDTYTAKVLGDENIQKAIAEKLSQIKQEEQHEA